MVTTLVSNEPYLDRFHKCLYRNNIIGPVSNGKSTLISTLMISGISGSHLSHSGPCTVFSTEYLLSPPLSNSTYVYLDLQSIEELTENVKVDITDAFMTGIEKLVKVKSTGKEAVSRVARAFANAFTNRLSEIGSMALTRFYSKSSTQELVESVDLEGLGKELFDLSEEKIREANIEWYWDRYFRGFFHDNLMIQYSNWLKEVREYYDFEKEYTEYVNEKNENTGRGRRQFKNIRLNELFKRLHGVDRSCALIISRVYIEAPASDTQFEGIVLIDNAGSTQDEKSAELVRTRMTESFKEAFILIGECSLKTEFTKLIGALKEYDLLDRSALILNKFDVYMNDKLGNQDEIYDFFVENDYEYQDLIDRYGGDIERLIRTGEGRDTFLRHLDSKQDGGFKKTILEELKKVASGLPTENIIVTSWFRDVVPGKFASPDTPATIGDLKLIVSSLKKACNKIASLIYITNSPTDYGFNLKVDYSNSNVHSCINKIQELHQGKCVFLWEDLIRCNNNPRDYGNSTGKPFWFVTVDSIIKCRKNSYKGYRHITNAQVYANYKVNGRDIYFGMLERKEIRDSLTELMKNVLIEIHHDANVSDYSSFKQIVTQQIESSFQYFIEYFYLQVVTGGLFVHGLANCLHVEKSFTVQDYQQAVEKTLDQITKKIVQYFVKVS